MAKIGFSLHPVAAAIRRAEKKLRSLRPKVGKADQKKIDLNLRALKKSYHLIRVICPKGQCALGPAVRAVVRAEGQVKPVRTECGISRLRSRANELIVSACVSRNRCHSGGLPS